MKILDTQDQVTEVTRLLPDSVCEAVVKKIDGELRRTTPETAHKLMSRLLGHYPDLKVHDPKTYALALTELFCAYPESVGRAVVDSVNGLPARLSFTPKTAQVKEAFEAETKRRKDIRANALWHMSERKRRARQAEEEATYKPSTCEYRKAQVERAIGAINKEFPRDARRQPIPPEHLVMPELDREALFRSHDEAVAKQ